MLRTNLYIDERQHQEISALARDEQQTFSQMVRHLLAEGIRLHKRSQLEKAADFMAREYASNEDLYVTKTIEGEDFLE